MALSKFNLNQLALSGHEKIFGRRVHFSATYGVEKSEIFRGPSSSLRVYHVQISLLLKIGKIFFPIFENGRFMTKMVDLTAHFGAICSVEMSEIS